MLTAEHPHVAQAAHIDQTRAQPVVHIVIVVGDLVSNVRDLRFESGLTSLEKSLAKLPELARIARRAVLENAFAAFERQVQPRELRIALFELIHDAQRLQVVLEAAVLAHACVQRILPRMTERRVAQIVRETDGLDQRLVQTQRTRDRARNLRDLDRMRHARAVQIAFVIHEHLRLVDQAAKRIRMDDAVAVALEFAADTPAAAPDGGGRVTTRRERRRARANPGLCRRRSLHYPR